jgi:hypothetical protein
MQRDVKEVGDVFCRITPILSWSIGYEKETPNSLGDGAVKALNFAIKVKSVAAGGRHVEAFFITDEGSEGGRTSEGTIFVNTDASQ